MTAYRMTAPDGQDYEIEGPDGATDDQVRAEIIRQNPHLGVVEQPQQEQQQPKPSIQASDPLAALTSGIVEPVMKMGSGIIAKPVSDVVGLGALVGRMFGAEGDDPLEIKKRVQQGLTYEPRTAAGKSEYNPLNAVPEVIGKGVSAVTTPIMSALRGDSSADSARGMAANAIGEAVPQALGVLGVRKLPNARSPVLAKSAEQVAGQKAALAELSNADWQRAAAIDAAKVARENNIVMNPASVAGSGHNVKMAAAGGSAHFNTAASIANRERWNNMVRKDLELPETGKLSQLTAETYDAVRKAIAKPYDEAASLGVLTPVDSAIKSIRSIEIPEILPAGEQAAGKMKRVTDLVAEQLESGMTGKDALNTAKTLRSEAKAVFSSIKSGNPVDPTTLATAKAKMRIAEKIDETISGNIQDPKWKKSFDDSRRKMAQSYAYERATDLVRRQIDPQVFAQEMMGRHYLTGNAKKMGEIAGNFPEIANVYAERGSTFGMPVRSGVAGTTGFALGSLYGMPVATSATTAALASIGEKLYGKRLRGEVAQAKYATPKDRRIYEPFVAPEPISPLQIGFTNRGGNWTYGRPDTPRPQAPESPSYPQVGMRTSFDEVTPADVQNTVRVPSDYARSAYTRATEAAKVAADKERALSAMSQRNMSSETRLNLMRELEKQRAIIQEQTAKMERFENQYGSMEPSARATTKGRTGQGPKTRAAQRGMLTGEQQ